MISIKEVKYILWIIRGKNTSKLLIQIHKREF